MQRLEGGCEGFVAAGNGGERGINKCSRTHAVQFCAPMGKTLATSNTKAEPAKVGRDGYSPGRYSLDLSSVKDAPLKLNGESSTFESLYAKLVDSKITDIPLSIGFKDAKYVTDAGDFCVEVEDCISCR